MTQGTFLPTFAVIGSDGVFCSTGEHFRLPEFQGLGAWLGAMERRGIGALWLHPQAGWRWLDNDIDECAPWIVAGGGRDDEQGEPYWTATRRGTYGLRELVQPVYEDRAPWAEARDAAALRDALLAYRNAVGDVWWRGPGANGTRLLRRLHTGAHATRLELPDAPPPVATSGVVRDSGHLSWTRALTARECERGYLHSYDVNGQYLAAVNGLALGVGAWEHHSAMTLPEKPGAWQPGYYRVKAAEKALGGSAPSILPERRAWVTTPTLRLLRESGARFDVLEAYTWAQSHRYLDAWYKQLRYARAHLSDEPIALGALKAIYRHTLTWMASDKWDRSEDTLYRPDWYHLATAQARAGVLRMVYRAGRKSGVWPVAVGSDCLYYVTEYADPLRGEHVTPTCGDNAPDDGLRVSPALGHVKIKDAAIPVGEIADLLRGERWNLGALQHALNVRAGRREAA